MPKRLRVMRHEQCGNPARPLGRCPQPLRPRIRRQREVAEARTHAEPVKRPPRPLCAATRAAGGGSDERRYPAIRFSTRAARALPRHAAARRRAIRRPASAERRVPAPAPPERRRDPLVPL